MLVQHGAFRQAGPVSREADVAELVGTIVATYELSFGRGFDTFEGVITLALLRARRDPCTDEAKPIPPDRLGVGRILPPARAPAPPKWGTLRWLRVMPSAPLASTPCDPVILAESPTFLRLLPPRRSTTDVMGGEWEGLRRLSAAGSDGKPLCVLGGLCAAGTPSTQRAPPSPAELGLTARFLLRALAT
jgi:hypothetical protein